MKGILFTPDNIKAIMEGRKTQTRRVINPQPLTPKMSRIWRWKLQEFNRVDFTKLMPLYARYRVGEVVYIKEAWATENKFNHLKPSEIPTDAAICYLTPEYDYDPFLMGKIRSPMFLREIFARYFIKITNVQPQRLQDITNEDARAEGIEPLVSGIGAGLLDNDGKPLGLAKHYILPFRELWDSINKSYPFSLNPWVWVISFKREDKK